MNFRRLVLLFGIEKISCYLHLSVPPSRTLEPILILMLQNTAVVLHDIARVTAKHKKAMFM